MIYDPKVIDGMVNLEELAVYIERDCECPMAIVCGETKHDYGLRLLKTLADEIRVFNKES